MNAQQSAVVLYNVGGFAALWVLGACWRGYKTDKLRQDIFNLRAELFEFAATGQIGFDDYFYRRLRAIFNSMIRFAHQLSFVRLITTLMLEKWRPLLTATGPNFIDELKTSDLDKAAICKLEQMHNRLINLIMLQILLTSIAAIPALVLAFVCSSILQAVRQRRAAGDLDFYKYQIEGHMQLMERQAVETRELELQRQEQPICVQV